MRKITAVKLISTLLVICFAFLLHATDLKKNIYISAASGFSFSKNISLVSKNTSLDVATFHATLDFSGDISIEGNCLFEPSFSSKQIKPNETIPLDISLKPSPIPITLTLRISVNGQEFTKQLSSNLSSPFDDSLDLGSISIPLGGIDNPQITINAHINISNSKINSKVITEGPIKADVSQLDFTSSSNKKVNLSSTGEGDSKVYISNTSMNIGIEGVTITGAGSVDILLLGRQEVPLGSFDLPLSSAVEIKGTPDKIQIVALSTTSTPSAPEPTSGGGKGKFPINKSILMIVIFSMLGVTAIILFIVFRITRQKPKYVTPSGIFLSTPTGIFSLNSNNPLIKIGRLPDNDLIVQNNYASRYHAEIFLQSGKWYIRDSGSKNGTFVNGTKITTPVLLRNGDKIKIGKDIYEFIIKQ